MKTRINLYLDEFKPTIVLVSLNFSLLIWMITLIGVVSVATLAYQAKQRSQTYAVQVATEVADKTALLNTLKTQQGTLQQDERLLADLQTSQLQLAAKNQIVDELSRREALKNQGFSSLMQDLAAYHHAGLWLTRISLDDQWLHIEGGVEQSTQVPVWVDNLRQSPFFQGKEFTQAKIYRDDDERLRFVLSSDPDVSLSEQADE